MTSPERECFPHPAETNVREKVRIRFRKDGSLRFVSHNDLMRCWDRLFRRANLPVRCSEGFHPKPRISSPLSLALGIIGVEELIEVELTLPLSLETIHTRLTDQSVAGLTILAVTRHPARERTEVVAVEYTCPLPIGTLLGPVEERRDSILASPTYRLTRKIPGKPDREIDLRPALEEIRICESEVLVRLRVVTGGTARIEEVLDALGLGQIVADGAVLSRSRVELATVCSGTEYVPSTLCKGAVHEESDVD